jgi:uracil-DNA glycosylase
MAVDVEPCVFWRGDDDATCVSAPAGVRARVDSWIADVGFRVGDEPGQHGHVAASPLNGPSGKELDTYFAGLSIPLEETVLADVYPVFLVHRTDTRGGPLPVKGRKQGDAIDAAYSPVAERLARSDGTTFQPASLPTRRVGRWDVPNFASERFGPWITSLILETRPELIVTLGQESWDTLTLLHAEPHHPARRVADLRLDGYGIVGDIRLDSQTFRWLPMPHPGLLMKAKPSPTGRSWTDAHQEWVER